ncbi:arginyltransferase [Lignipirellula cremea]|uniref:Arginyl-tRNA-protein transferase n=1 Tax=Lignipirellula cremea TaxID=2528010 RepID=A0A518E1H0_9BACT|nr:arginyltransferase [Lignipirellula cremea]QDU97913.1 arginyl-tRNA-protein transferase [Lignipirellula cremea]
MKKNFSNELIVYDGCEKCPYLPNRIARLPLRLPNQELSGEQFDERLASGDRRSGVYLYHTECPSCSSCIPIRLPVADFAPGATMRRVKRQGDRLLRTVISEPTVDQQRIDLFNKHRTGRGLSHEQPAVDALGYEMFLTETCCDTIEMAYYLDEELVGVAICDHGQESISAVYCYYDPDYSRLSLGVYSVMKQIEQCRLWGAQYLYLGLYIAESPHMSYKSRYQPHELLVKGKWVRSDAAAPRPR